MATSETPNSAPAAAPSSNASARGRTWRRVETRTRAAPIAKIPPSTAISAARDALRVVRAAAGQSDDHERGGGDRHADPLPPSQVKAEEALGKHGEEQESAGEDRLHDRQRRERERADVQTPGHDRHDPADQEPSGAKQTGGAAHRMPDHDRRGEAAPGCLNRKARLVATAEASARISPRITTNDLSAVWVARKAPGCLGPARSSHPIAETASRAAGGAVAVAF
jgi:hypothetical protein